jgi:HD-GYP domain-containing protein (c-di-GMP phosphodiesterase class II)
MFDQAPQADLIFVGHAIEGVSLMELAQGLRGQYVSAPILYLTTQREGFEKKNFLKNGFTDAFLLPLDGTFLKRSIEDLTAQVKKFKSYRPVKIIDLQPDEQLDFEVRVFLPQNKRYMTYTSAGEKLESDKVTKLKKHKIGSLFVAREDMKKFYEYSANRLIALGSNDNQSAMSETEKTERLQGAVRDLFNTVVNTATDEATVDRGRGLVEDVKGIVNQYILNSAPSEWYTKLQQTIGESQDSYSHTTNVSSFAALFSIALKMGKPEELAMAGLFHDLGMADVPLSIASKPESEWTPEERKMYQKHPEYSLDIMKARKLIVPQPVMNAVVQHHERWDGKGYPKGIPGERMTVEAKIVALADQFDYLTCAQEGKRRLSPEEAIREISNSGQFDPEFMYAATKVIIQPSATTPAAQAVPS